MEWWQSLLIALCPSILSTVVAIVVPVTQIRSAKKERLAKYEFDKRQHISRKRLDMEFEIYKELSEKVVALVTTCLGLLFNSEFDYNQIGIKTQDNEDIETHDSLIDLLNEANEAINKYAIFIPEKWYVKFEQIKNMCRQQINEFRDYAIDGKLKNKSIQNIKKECDKRYDKIDHIFDDLVSELREYISKLGTNTTENNQEIEKTAE